MVQSWQAEKAWSDKFIPEIQSILGQIFFNVASESEDQLRNTDLICLELEGEGGRIGARVRRNKYLREYQYQFTIRSGTRWGGLTEFDKILQGWGDYFFYGIANRMNDGFSQYILGDLNIFREILIKKVEAGISKDNDDGTSFKAYKWEDMPASFFKAISPPELRIDVCKFCKVKGDPYNGQAKKVLCPECLRLSDYTLVIQRHNDIVNRINGRKNTP